MSIDYTKDIHYVKSFMLPEDALKIYEYAKQHDSLFSDYGNNEMEFTVHTYNEIMNNDLNLGNLMQQYAMLVYHFVKDNYEENFEQFIEAKTHIARFSEGSGMHEHFDSNRPKDIATLVYLNNDYEGGEIYFPDYNLTFKPEPGDLLTFPDNPNYIHGVKPITKGIRYTTPRWFTRIL